MRGLPIAALIAVAGAIAGAALAAAQPVPGAKEAGGAVFAGMLGEARLYTTPTDPAPAVWGNARNHCEGLEFGGHSDWALPSGTELEVLHKNQAAIGGFKPTDYATAEPGGAIVIRDFRSGYVGEARVWDVLAFRCVRKG